MKTTDINLRPILLAMLLITCFSVEATTLEFAYTFEDDTILEGTFNGTIQTDLDTVYINSFGLVKYAGAALESIEDTEIRSDSDYPSGALQPLVSFSGNEMDVFVCAQGFSLAGNCTFSPDGGFYLGTFNNNSGAGSSSGSVFEGYNAGRWSLTAVPIPAASWLLASGLFGLLGIRKKQMSQTI